MSNTDHRAFLRARDHLRRVREQQLQPKPRLTITEIAPPGRDKQTDVVDHLVSED